MKLTDEDVVISYRATAEPSEGEVIDLEGRQRRGSGQEKVVFRVNKLSVRTTFDPVDSEMGYLSIEVYGHLVKLDGSLGTMRRHVSPSDLSVVGREKYAELENELKHFAIAAYSETLRTLGA